MHKNKICYIVSDVNESHQLNALFDGIKQSGADVSLIVTTADAEPEIYKLFKSKGFPVYFIKCAGKKDFLAAWIKLYKILGEIKPDIVHTHTQNAAILGLSAAKFRGVKKRFQTRHHSDELHMYYPHAVWYDRFCNRLSAHIIATSQNVRSILVEKEYVDPKKVSIIHHGFDFEDFETDNRIVEELKQKYKLNESYPVIGVISRFVHGKGIQYIIPAFASILKKYPEAKLVLANARGSYDSEIKNLLDEHLKPDKYVLIEFESRIFELYKTFDIFIHVPINPEFEAFGQTYIEALAMKIPSIFTLSGIAKDFIVDRENALVVDFCNSEMIAQSIEAIMEIPYLREKISEQGRIDVEKRFYIDKMVNLFNEKYSTI